MENFDDLNLNENILKSIYLYGYKQPSKIQIKGIESINTGKDCILQSQSGTGKTATYLLGVINNLDVNKISLIITPTRELAEQVYNVAINLAKYTDYNIIKCIGGTDINELRKTLSSAHLIIGTIGRIYHMIIDKKININKLKIIVLDEADELLSNGINDKLKSIFAMIPINIQLILISATMSLDVFNFSKEHMFEPIKVLLKNTEIMVELISQFYLDVEVEENKFDTLLDLYNLISTSQTIIFCNTINKIEWLEQNLKTNNFAASTIHSNMTQFDRDKIVKEFREGTTRILITTDLLSRGIDICDVNMVINYDIPVNKECYVHRIGRTGRFDKKGVAITLIKMKDQSDVKIYNKLKNYYKIDIKEMPPNINTFL
jgi:superfamily II DNA/RNA helicase